MSKHNLTPKPKSPPGTSFPTNFQHLSSSIKICLFLVTLFNAILLNLPTQYILVFNILTDITFFYVVYLKPCSNMSGTLIRYIKKHNYFLKLPFDCFITCNMDTDMDNFIHTSVTFYIAYVFKIKYL